MGKTPIYSNQMINIHLSKINKCYHVIVTNKTKTDLEFTKVSVYEENGEAVVFSNKSVTINHSEEKRVITIIAVEESNIQEKYIVLEFNNSDEVFKEVVYLSDY